MNLTIAGKVLATLGALLLPLLASAQTAPPGQGGDVFGVEIGDIRAQEKSCQDRKEAAELRLNDELRRCQAIQNGPAREQCKSRASDAYDRETDQINRECAQIQRRPAAAGSSGGGSVSTPPSSPPSRRTGTPPSARQPRPSSGAPQAGRSRQTTPPPTYSAGRNAPPPGAGLLLTAPTGSCSADVASQRAAIADALYSMRVTPVHDLTRPHEGVRVIADILTSMGFGYLTQGVVAAGVAIAERAGITAMLAGSRNWMAIVKAPPRSSIPRPPSSRGGPTPSTGRAPAPATSSPSPAPVNPTTTLVPLARPLPPGYAGLIPAAVRNTLMWRIQRIQEELCSCGPTCLRMVAETVERRLVSEEAIRQRLGLMWSELRGMNIATLAEGMRRFLQGTPVYLARGTATIEQLEAATATGYPAIAHVGEMELGHYVIVDAVIGPAGSRIVLVRDPANLAHVLDPQNRQLLQMAGYTNAPWYTEKEFLQAFRGWAILTGPAAVP